MAAAAPLASAAIAAAPFALQGVGQIMQGQAAAGEARYRAGVSRFQAAQSKEEARVAKTAADQTDTQLREELEHTVGTIRAIRASTGAAADSPTSRAIIDEEKRVSGRERSIRRGSELQKARRLEQDAALYGSDALFHRAGAKYALLSSYVAAAGSLARGGYAGRQEYLSAIGR